MAAGEYEMDVKPDIMLMEQALDPLATGDLRIPRFQRPFIWRPEQMLDLFDSIERGYPIGSLLFWQTPTRQASLDRIGDIAVPAAPEGHAVSYVLDGHQRLSTLFATLRRPLELARSSEQRNWMWWPYRVLGESEETTNRYRHWKRTTPPPANYLPLRAILRTMDFLGWARDLEEHAAADMDVPRLVSEAEQIASRIKSYKIAVVHLVGGQLTDAVEVFSRVNSTGQPIRPMQMVSALTYEPGSEDSLADRIDRMVALVADTGFGEVSSDAVFRAVLAVSGEENIQEARWDALAHRVGPHLSTAVADTEDALLRAIAFLRDELTIPLARLIPYDAQLTLLTAFFGRCPHPDAGRRDELARWFWTTSWSGYFAGANTTQIKQSLRDIRRFADEGGRLAETGDRARPFPDRFDLRSSRVRAYLIWELREFPSRLDTTGEPINALSRLTRDPTSTYRQVVYRPRMVEASSPANRLIMPTALRVSVKNALLSISDELRSRVLASHGIPEQSLDALRLGDDEGFVNIRAKELAQRERDFMTRYDVSEATTSPGETDIDTE